MFSTSRARALCCAVLFLLGVVRWWPDLPPEARFPSHPETVRLARSWASTGSLANPFHAGKTGPSAHAAPVYPVFMGTLLRIFGDGRSGLFALAMSSAIFMAAQAALFPLAAVHLGVAFEAGVLAAIAWILAKIRPFPEYEASLAGLLVILLTIVLARWAGSSGGRAISLLAGALFAFTALTTSAAAIVVAVWFLTPLAAPLWRHRRLEIALFALSASALLSPWLVRNFNLFGGLILMRGNFGLELAISNNACAEVSLVENLLSQCFQASHPNTSAGEAKRVVSLGEPGYSRQRTQEALAWITANPLRFASLTARRIVRFWIPSETGDPIGETLLPAFTRERLWVYGMTLMSIFGLMRLWRACPPGALLCSLWLSLFPLVYYCPIPRALPAADLMDYLSPRRRRDLAARPAIADWSASHVRRPSSNRKCARNPSGPWRS